MISIYWISEFLGTCNYKWKSELRKIAMFFFVYIVLFECRRTSIYRKIGGCIKEHIYMIDMMFVKLQCTPTSTQLDSWFKHNLSFANKGFLTQCTRRVKQGLIMSTSFSIKVNPRNCFMTNIDTNDSSCTIFWGRYTQLAKWRGLNIAFCSAQSFITSTNPCMHGEAILIVKEMSALITCAYCKYDLMYAFQ